jgi:hypothetical protein
VKEVFPGVVTQMGVNRVGVVVPDADGEATVDGGVTEEFASDLEFQGADLGVGVYSPAGEHSPPHCTLALTLRSATYCSWVLALRGENEVQNLLEALHVANVSLPHPKPYPGLFTSLPSIRPPSIFHPVSCSACR